jgi:hypothetical protein
VTLYRVFWDDGTLASPVATSYSNERDAEAELERIVATFPADERAQVRADLHVQPLCPGHAELGQPDGACWPCEGDPDAEGLQPSRQRLVDVVL